MAASSTQQLGLLDLNGSVANGFSSAIAKTRSIVVATTTTTNSDVFNCGRRVGRSNCISHSVNENFNPSRSCQAKQSLQGNQDKQRRSSTSTVGANVTNTLVSSSRALASRQPTTATAARLHRNTLRSSSARQCITTANNCNQQNPLKTRGFSCGSSNKARNSLQAPLASLTNLPAIKTTTITTTSSAAVAVARTLSQLANSTARRNRLILPSSSRPQTSSRPQSLQVVSSATTNSRVRQGALFARRQYHITPTATSLPSTTSPLKASRQTGSRTNHASLLSQVNKTANITTTTTTTTTSTKSTSSCRQTANRSSGSNHHHHLVASREFGVGGSKTKSSLGKTSSKFSLASSTSSLSLAVVKRARPSPQTPSSQHDTSSCRYTSIYNRPTTGSGIANLRAASVSSVVGTINYSCGRNNSNNKTNNRSISTGAYATTTKQRISSGNCSSGNNNSTSFNLNQKPTTLTTNDNVPETEAATTEALLLQRSRNNNQTERFVVTSCIEEDNSHNFTCETENKETFSTNIHPELAQINISTNLNSSISQKDKQEDGCMKIHTRSPLGSASGDTSNTNSNSSQLDSTTINTNITKDSILNESIMISLDNRFVALDNKKPVPDLDIPIILDSICNYYDLEPRPFARGKFAQVKRCTNKTSKQCFAAKCIKKRRRLIDIRHEILLEIEALKLSYFTSHIVQLYEVFETPTEMILILEMANGGELQRVLDDEESIDEKNAKKMVAQILEGLVQLHDNDIAHLDIKPQNLLLTSPYPDGDIKLCDFGISRRISNDCEIREICGTPDYVAPEILRYDPISLATDMWSLGVLTYVILSGYSPFGSENKQQTFCNITQAPLDFPNELFSKISNEALDFMQKLIVREPTERLTSREARNHPWLSL